VPKVFELYNDIIIKLRGAGFGFDILVAKLPFWRCSPEGKRALPARKLDCRLLLIM
jgi:hypothetical protein